MGHPIAQRRIDARLQEAKQVGRLYHWTTMEGCRGILTTNDFRNGGRPGGGGPLSFTRDKDPEFWAGGRQVWRFTVDGDLISERFKIGPYADYKLGFSRTGGRPEAEERVVLPKNKTLRPADKYIIELGWHGGNLSLDDAAEMVDEVAMLGGDWYEAEEEFGWDQNLIQLAHDMKECIDLAEDRRIQLEDYF